MNAKDFAAMRLFRIDRELTLELENAVQACPPVDLLPLQAQGHGFTHLAEVKPGVFHLEMLTKERLLPKKVIKPVVAQRATEFEMLNGHKPGFTHLAEVVAAMLPKAPIFEFKTHALIYCKTVIVGAGSMNKCKALLDLLVHGLFAASEENEPQLRYLPVAVNADIPATFRGWIEAKDDCFLEGVDDPQAAYLPEHLLLGTSFKSKGAESEAGQSSVISGKGVDLSDSKIERIIERVTELELIYDEVPFRLTDEFVVKGMKYPASKLDDPDSNAFVITHHVTRLWAELLEAFGGEKCN